MGVPTGSGSGPDGLATLLMREQFEKKCPHIRPTSSTGLSIPAVRSACEGAPRLALRAALGYDFDMKSALREDKRLRRLKADLRLTAGERLQAFVSHSREMVLLSRVRVRQQAQSESPRSET